MPEPVERTNPEGTDFAWVMQTTFVLTIVLGAPIVALASIPVSLPTWESRVSFAIRVGAILWIVVALGAFAYERRTAERRQESGKDVESERPDSADMAAPRASDSDAAVSDAAVSGARSGEAATDEDARSEDQSAASVSVSSESRAET